MNRIFVSLYILIVVSIILIGWGADKIWQAYSPEKPLTELEQTLIESLTESTLQQFQTKGAEQKIYAVLMDAEDLAESSLAEAINSGEIVSVYDDVGNKQIFKRQPQSQKIIQITVTADDLQRSNWYLVLLCVFYFFLALIIYFWVWPLTRDLKKLQAQTLDLGRDGVPNQVSLGKRSAIFELARSFNAMSDRIRELIASHKEMTSAVSHELRTPLARMKFSLEMLRDHKEAQVLANQIEAVREDVTEMDKLITSLLTYAGFEQHSQILDLQSGDLSALVSQVLKRCENHTIRWHFDDQLNQQSVECEWRLMEHAIANIIQNAFRYAHGMVMVYAAIKNGMCEVVVEDDGTGIDESDYSKVFEPFVRLPGQKKQSGFGLGLAIVKRILLWHHGSVTVSRSDLGGARFTLTWPLTNSKM